MAHLAADARKARAVLIARARTVGKLALSIFSSTCVGFRVLGFRV